MADVRLRVEDGHDGLRVEVGPAAPTVLPRADPAAAAEPLEPVEPTMPRVPRHSTESMDLRELEAIVNNKDGFFL